MDQASTLRDGQHSLPLKQPGRNAILCLAVASGKGGVGKTFLTVNLAAALARQQRRVLVVDADLGLPNTDILLGATPAHTLEDCLFRGTELADVVVRTPFGIDLLAAHSGARELVDLGEARLSLLAENLIRFAGGYDALIFDCASGINRSVTAFLGAAPQSLIVVQPDPTSLMDAYALIKVIRREGLASRLSLVLNAVRQPTVGDRVLAQLQAVVRDYLNLDLDCLGKIPHAPRAASAMHARVPLAVFDETDPATREIFAIARRLLHSQQTAGEAGRLNASALLQGMLSRKPEP